MSQFWESFLSLVCVYPGSLAVITPDLGHLTQDTGPVTPDSHIRGARTQTRGARTLSWAGDSVRIYYDTHHHAPCLSIYIFDRNQSLGHVHNSFNRKVENGRKILENPLINAIYYIFKLD